MTSVKVTRRWSHSAYEDYSSCGEKYRLKRIQKVPDQPGVARVAGTAFHFWAECYDFDHVNGQGHDDSRSFADVFEQALKDEEERHQIPREQFQVSGKPTKDKPNKEDITHWRDALGPELCRMYAEWRDNSDFTIAQDLPQDANGNTVGIEYELSYKVGQVEEKAYVDRIEYDINGNLGVIDLKTWARKRTSVQLQTYIVGLNKRGVPAMWGAYYHARKGVADTPTFHTGWDEHRLAVLHEQAAVMEASGFYLPRISDDCGWCSVRAHCAFAPKKES
jgi:hypothetical protein